MTFIVVKYLLTTKWVQGILASDALISIENANSCLNSRNPAPKNMVLEGALVREGDAPCSMQVVSRLDLLCMASIRRRPNLRPTVSRSFGSLHKTVMQMLIKHDALCTETRLAQPSKVGCTRFGGPSFERNISVRFLC